jgi:hypothetical protein
MQLTQLLTLGLAVLASAAPSPQVENKHRRPPPSDGERSAMARQAARLCEALEGQRIEKPVAMCRNLRTRGNPKHVMYTMTKKTQQGVAGNEEGDEAPRDCQQRMAAAILRPECQEGCANEDQDGWIFG